MCVNVIFNCILIVNKIMSRPHLAIREFSSLNPEKESNESQIFEIDKIDV